MNKLMYVCMLLLTALILGACGGSPPSTEALPQLTTDEPVMTEESMPTEAPTETAIEVSTEVPTIAPEENSAEPLEGEVFIDIIGTKFSESAVTIRVGTVVTWTNKSDNEHTVTSDDGLFDSSVSDGGGTFSFTFTEAGEFPYHCEIHRSMKGKVIVVK